MKAVRDDLRKVGHDTIFHDLYKKEFPPLLSVEEIPAAGKIAQVVKVHCDELSSADGIVIVHPN